jgi:hypothetical protein
MYTGFSELMIGLKKAVLNSLPKILGLAYSPEAEAADRALTENANARRMGLAKDNELQKLEADVMKKRMARLLVREDDKHPGATAAADTALAEAIKARNAREAALLADPEGEAGKAAILEKQSQQTKETADGLLSSNVKLGLAAGGLVVGVMAIVPLLVKGIELAVLGTGKGVTGLFGKLFGAGKGPAPGSMEGWKSGATAMSQGAGAPTTAKGVGMGALADLGKGFTSAASWLMKGLAIGASMVAIGYGLGKLAEGVKPWEDIKADAMIAAAGALAVITGAIAGFAAMGKFLANPAAIAGIVLVELAIAGLGLALRAFPVDVLNSLATIMATTLKGLGDVITNIFNGISGVFKSIGDSITNIIDKFVELNKSGIDATTQQIKTLSDIPSEKIRATAVAIAELKTALDGFGGGFWENVGRGITSLFGGDQASQVERMAAAMERYKKSVSVLQETNSGEFVLKPIDIGLYTQLQQTLDETKKKIDTTFSKKTYEETFVATTKAIDGTYNVKTSKLDITLEQTREAIKKTFTPPYEELRILTQAIKDAVSNASSGLTSPTGVPPGGGTVPNISQGTWLKGVMGYFGGSSRVLTGGPTQTDVDNYIKAMSSKEGNHNSINENPQGPGKKPTFAMGQIQLMPDVARVLAKELGYNNLAGIKDNEQLARTWVSSLKDTEKTKFYEAYARGNYKTMSQGVGRDLTEAEWRAGQFGPNSVISAIKNPNAALTTAQADAMSPVNMPAFKRGFAAAGLNGLVAQLGTYVTSKPGYNVTNASAAASGGTLRTGTGSNQLYLNEQGKLMRGDSEVDPKKAVGDTLTAVSNEGDTQGKILNLLEQTYNLHVEGYNNNKKNERFKGFTAGL